MTPRRTGSATASGAARGAPAGQASQTPVKALGEAASKKSHKKSRP